MASDLKEKLDALKIDREHDTPSTGVGLKIALGVLVLAVAGTGAWWTLRSKAVLVRTTTVEAAVAGGGGASSVLNASGYVTARRQATVSSRVTGKVVEVLVENHWGPTVIPDHVVKILEHATGLGLLIDRVRLRVTPH